jgi:hypothetical protein
MIRSAPLPYCHPTRDPSLPPAPSLSVIGVPEKEKRGIDYSPARACAAIRRWQPFARNTPTWSMNSDPATQSKRVCALAGGKHEEICDRAPHTGDVRSFAAGYCYDHAVTGRDEKARATPRQRTLVCRSRASVWPAVRSGRSDLPGKRPRHRLPGVSSSNRGRSRSKKRDLIFPFWSPPSPNLQHGPCRRV